MVNKIHGSLSQQSQEMKIAGGNKANAMTVKCSTIAKIVIGVMAVLAAIAFGTAAVLTATPMLFFGTAIALFAICILLRKKKGC